MLHLAKDLTLPLDAVSRTFGILAVRGAGKSNTAAVMAEEMFAAGLPFVVIDPVGSWYGLRSSADGTSAGLPVPIFGGKHGDVPLERGSGELIADLVVEKRLTCVLDLSRFDSESDKKVFLLAFARRLYQKNENPLHLFLEEADDYIPQSPMGDEKHLLRAWENIVRRGRARGLGMTLITQRSAAVAKMVLTQVETLFAMRTTGPQDIAAIEAWVKYHQVGKGVLSTLASLDDGEAWVWSPHYLKTMARHQMRRRSTFDSGATPKNVRAKDTRPPATLADIDLAALQERMAATIEKAKADDPKELRKALAEKDKRIKELEKAASGSSTSHEAAKVATPVLTPDDRTSLVLLSGQITDLHEALVERIEQHHLVAIGTLSEMLKNFENDVVTTARETAAGFGTLLSSKGYERLLGTLHAVAASAKSASDYSKSITTPARSTWHSNAEHAEPVRVASGTHRHAAKANLPPGELAVLTAALQYPGLDRNRLGILTGYKRSSRDAYIVRLASKGFIQVQGSGLFPTEAGREWLGDAFEPLPTGIALIKYWQDRLPEGERRTFYVLVRADGKEIDREVIDRETGYKRSSRDAYLVRLKARGLVEFAGRGKVRASEELFS